MKKTLFILLMTSCFSAFADQNVSTEGRDIITESLTDQLNKLALDCKLINGNESSLDDAFNQTVSNNALNVVNTTKTHITADLDSTTKHLYASMMQMTDKGYLEYKLDFSMSSNMVITQVVSKINFIKLTNNVISSIPIFEARCSTGIN